MHSESLLFVSEVSLLRLYSFSSLGDQTAVIMNRMKVPLTSPLEWDRTKSSPKREVYADGFAVLVRDPRQLLASDRKAHRKWSHVFSL